MSRTICIPPKIEEYLAYFFILAFIIFICLYFMIKYIHNTITNNPCNVSRKRYIVSEGFDTSDDYKAYYSDLDKRCDILDKKIQTMTDTLESTNFDYNHLKHDICYVTNTIDEITTQNYEISVSNETDPEKLKKMKDEQKKKAENYIATTKKSYIQTHDNIPLVECFDDDLNSQNSLLPDENLELTDEQNIELKNFKIELEKKINEINSNLSVFDNNLVNIQKNISNDILKQYYTTLNYNDKYISNIKKTVPKIKKSVDEQKSFLQINKIEGFLDSDVLTFPKIKKGLYDTDESIDQGERISTLEIHCYESEKKLNTIYKTINQYKQTALQQRTDIEKLKNVTTEEGVINTIKSLN